MARPGRRNDSILSWVRSRYQTRGDQNGGNMVSGNKLNGLLVHNSDNTTIQGDFFGVGANNTSAVGNKGNGVLVNGSSENTVVGGVIPLGNVSGDNTLNGIKVGGTASKFITFNTFGGLLAFKGAAPNGNDGLLVTSTGGHITARTNVFSGNRRNGIELAGGATGVTVDPNIVGLTTNGDAVLPNGGDGVLIDGLDRLGRYLRNSGKPVVDRGLRNLVKGNVTHPRG